MLSEQINQVISNPDLSFTQRIEYIERLLMVDALERNNWVKLKAAKDLKITYRIFNYKCERFKLFLSSPRKRKRIQLPVV